jgi:hypothetical protein
MRDFLELIEDREATRCHAPQLSLHRQAIHLVADEPGVRAEIDDAIARLRFHLAEELFAGEKVMVQEPAF